MNPGTGLRFFALSALLAAAPAAAQERSAGPELRLRLERSIGSDLGDAAYTFNRVGDLAVSRGGSLFVLDTGDRQVKVYDAAGRFVRAFGREGHGPGEFTRPQHLRLDSLLHVFDPQQGRISTFALDGAHRRTARLPTPDGVPITARYPLRGGVSLASTLAHLSYGSPGHDAHRRVLLLTPAGAVADTLLVFHSGSTIWHPADQEVPWGVARSPFGPAGAWAVWGDSLVAVADGYRATVTWYRPAEGALRPVATARIPAAPRAVTAADLRDVERALRATNPRRLPRLRLEAPPRWSVATRALFADDGALWIENGGDAGASHTWTVFEHGGRLRHRLRLPAGFELRVVQGGRLYGVARTDADAEVVQVYRMEGAR